MNLAVHHLAVLVSDLGRSQSFYSGVLGLPLHSRQEGRSVWLTLSHGVLLMLELAAQADGHAAPMGWRCVALRIAKASRDEWRARLQEAGVTIERESLHTLYFRDPDGALVALSHYPE